MTDVARGPHFELTKYVWSLHESRHMADAADKVVAVDADGKRTVIKDRHGAVPRAERGDP